MPVHALRVPDEEWDAWEAAARDRHESVAQFIRSVMNREAGAPDPAAAKVRGRAKAKAAPAAAACVRERFHRPGSFCKACGVTAPG